MSDAKVPDDAETAPSIDELERTAIPATFRRAPLLGRIVGSGIAFGIGLGVVLGLSLPNSTGVGRGMVAVLMALGFGMICGLTAGAIATRADSRSVKQSRRTRQAQHSDADVSPTGATEDGR